MLNLFTIVFVTSFSTVAFAAASGSGFRPQTGVFIYGDPAVANAIRERCGTVRRNVSDCVHDEYARQQALRAAGATSRASPSADPNSPRESTGAIAHTAPGAPAAPAAPAGPAAPAEAPSARGATVSGPKEPGAFVSATEADATARNQSLEQAVEAEKRAEQARYNAKYERSLADTLATNYDSLRNFLAPRQASTNPQLQSEAASRLREPPQFPERFREIGGDLGLHTNADLQMRAPDYVVKLSEDSEKQDDLAKKLDLDASRARMAAAQLDDFKEKLDSRTANMNSVGGLAPAGTGNAAYPSAAQNGPGYTGGVKAAADRQSRITSSTEEKLPSGQSKGIARGLASVADGKNGSEITAAGETIIDPRTGKPAKGESLREILKRRLAAAREKEGRAGAAGAGESGEGARKSSFEQFFEGKAAEGAGKNGAMGAQAEAEGKPGFFLSGAETDKVVAKLVGSLNGQEANGGNEVFGSADISIFQRMTAFLRKAEAGKKVAGQ